MSNLDQTRRISPEEALKLLEEAWSYWAPEYVSTSQDTAAAPEYFEYHAAA